MDPYSRKSWVQEFANGKSQSTCPLHLWDRWIVTILVCIGEDVCYGGKCLLVTVDLCVTYYWPMHSFMYCWYLHSVFPVTECCGQLYIPYYWSLNSALCTTDPSTLHDILQTPVVCLIYYWPLHSILLTHALCITHYYPPNCNTDIVFLMGAVIGYFLLYPGDIELFNVGRSWSSPGCLPWP